MSKFYWPNFSPGPNTGPSFKLLAGKATITGDDIVAHPAAILQVSTWRKAGRHSGTHTELVLALDVQGETRFKRANTPDLVAALRATISQAESDLNSSFGGKPCYSPETLASIRKDMAAAKAALEGRPTVIVGRHPGLVAWLQARGISGEVREHLDPKTLTAPSKVIGVLPTLLVEELLAAGHEVILAVLPRIAPDQRGKELTPAEMDAAGATLRRVVACRTESV